MEEVSFTVHRCETSEDAKLAQAGIVAVFRALGQNITEKTGITRLAEPVRIIMRNERDEVVGGLVGDIFGGWLHVELLWVDKSVRKRGHGTKLMSMAERIALEKGCTHSYLNTYSFEARPFYEDLGYEVFGTLDDYPHGFSKFFLKKQLKQQQAI